MPLSGGTILVNARVRHLDYIEELSIVLAHRWDPERIFVIFTANFDESNTHGQKPTVILAAYVGHAYQWLRFNKKLARLQTAYGFKVFHATDFKGRRREFSGWSDEKCAALISDLTELVRDNLALGMTIALDYNRFMNEYRAPPIPSKMHMDSQYGACFRACMGHLIDFLALRQHRDKLNIVIERGHPNVRDCERIFDDLKKRFHNIDVDILGSFTIERKDTWPPLLVADLLAHTYSMVRAHNAAGTLPAGALQPAKTLKGALAFLELAPNALAELKSGYIRFRQLEIDEWRARKAAKKASSLVGRQPS